MKPVAANCSMVWMSPESMDRTVIAASCSSCEPGLTNESAAVTAGAAAAAGEEELQRASLRCRLGATAAGCLLRV